MNEVTKYPDTVGIYQMGIVPNCDICGHRQAILVINPEAATRCFLCEECASRPLRPRYPMHSIEWDMEHSPTIYLMRVARGNPKNVNLERVEAMARDILHVRQWEIDACKTELRM